MRRGERDGMETVLSFYFSISLSFSLFFSLSLSSLSIITFSLLLLFPQNWSAAQLWGRQKFSFYPSFCIQFTYKSSSSHCSMKRKEERKKSCKRDWNRLLIHRITSRMMRDMCVMKRGRKKESREKEKKEERKRKARVLKCVCLGMGTRQAFLMSYNLV